MFYRQLIRPILFQLTEDNPEYAHDVTIKLLQYLGASPILHLANNGIGALEHHSLAKTIWGINFPNPVGLAGGFDKDGVAIPALAALGFGFIEVGTVTLRPQSGQTKPRLFRLPASEAIINRMGFNNLGVNALAKRLRDIWPPPVPIGVSLGKNKDTLEEDAAVEYCQALSVLHPYLDYLAVNVSSPNTPGLRNLQLRSALDNLLEQLQITLKNLAQGGNPKPLLLKIAPDLTHEQLVELLEVCEARGVAGLISANTTLNREGLAKADLLKAQEAGGLSGRPLTIRSRELVALIHRETAGKLPIIGVGGIMTPDDALRMLDAGASLVQIYTGLVYSGIGLVKKINQAILKKR